MIDDKILKQVTREQIKLIAQIMVLLDQHDQEAIPKLITSARDAKKESQNILIRALLYSIYIGGDMDILVTLPDRYDTMNYLIGLNRLFKSSESPAGVLCHTLFSCVGDLGQFIAMEEKNKTILSRIFSGYLKNPLICTVACSMLGNMIYPRVGGFIGAIAGLYIAGKDPGIAEKELREKFDWYLGDSGLQVPSDKSLSEIVILAKENQFIVHGKWSWNQLANANLDSIDKRRLMHMKLFRETVRIILTLAESEDFTEGLERLKLNLARA